MRHIYIDEKGRVFEGEWADLFSNIDEKIKQETDKMKTKGGNKMGKIFENVQVNKVVKFNKEDGKIKRKAKMVKAITVESVKDTFNTPETYLASGMVGLQQGLKYKGDFKAGSKAGIATAAVLAGINVAGSLAANMDKIKKA